MKSNILLVCVIAAAMLLVSPIAALETILPPSVNIPQVVNTGGYNAPSVDFYKPPVCYECVPTPTPAPVYETIGITLNSPNTKIKQHSNVQLIATQTYGTPVLSTARWSWVIQPARPLTAYSTSGTTTTLKVSSFGKWKITVNVRDDVQLLNGRYTKDIIFTEK